jgi:hypothetical protein
MAPAGEEDKNRGIIFDKTSFLNEKIKGVLFINIS